jgi:hypothetical protein
MKNISRQHLHVATDVMRMAAESFLPHYQFASKLIAGLACPPEILICSEYNLSQFPFFARSLAQ